MDCIVLNAGGSDMLKRQLRDIRRRLGLATLFAVMCVAAQTVAASSDDVIYTIDFSAPPRVDAADWLRNQGFEFKLGADELGFGFAGARLNVETQDQVAGLIVKQLSLPKTKRIRVHWGVERYPDGADWENGVYRVPLAIMLSFGDERIDSGAFFLPDVPHFIGLFLGKNEQQGKPYTAQYYKKAGRYYCAPCGAPEGQTVVAEFDLEKAYTSQFGKAEIPDLSSFGFQMNTKDTSGGARAFIKKVEFLI